MASTRPRLAIFDPTTLLSARSGKPSNAAFMLTISSGAEVAKETMVIPIIILDMLSLKEKATADFNNQLPPNISKDRPIMINNILGIRKILTNIAELGGERRQEFH